MRRTLRDAPEDVHRDAPHAVEHEGTEAYHTGYGLYMRDVGYERTRKGVFFTDACEAYMQGAKRFVAQHRILEDCRVGDDEHLERGPRACILGDCVPLKANVPIDVEGVTVFINTASGRVVLIDGSPSPLSILCPHGFPRGHYRVGAERYVLSFWL